MNTSDMLTHTWILSEAQESGNGIKKKGTENQANSNNGQLQAATQQRLRLSLKELLGVSSDWKDVNRKNPASAAGNASGLPVDFQSQQIERIVEAIALTLPSGGVGGNTSMLGGAAGTLSTDAASVMYEEHCVKELAYDLGVDPRALKSKLQSLFGKTTVQGSDQQQIEKLQSLQFHL